MGLRSKILCPSYPESIPRIFMQFSIKQKTYLTYWICLRTLWETSLAASRMLLNYSTLCMVPSVYQRRNLNKTRRNHSKDSSLESNKCITNCVVPTDVTDNRS